MRVIGWLDVWRCGMYTTTSHYLQLIFNGLCMVSNISITDDNANIPTVSHHQKIVTNWNTVKQEFRIRSFEKSILEILILLHYSRNISISVTLLRITIVQWTNETPLSNKYFLFQIISVIQVPAVINILFKFYNWCKILHFAVLFNSCLIYDFLQWCHKRRDLSICLDFKAPYIVSKHFYWCQINLQVRQTGMNAINLNN